MPELRPDPDFDAAAVEPLGAKRLAELIVKEAYRDAGVAQALRLAVASLQSDEMLAEALTDECRMLRRDDRFYDYREASHLVATLERIVESICGDLLPRSPRRAAGLLADVIRLDAYAIEHSDDHDDEIAEVIEDCVLAFGRAWTAVAERDVGELAAEILALLTTDAYNMRGGLIGSCREALGVEGLEVLEQLAQSALHTMPDAGSADPLLRALPAITAARAVLFGPKELGEDGVYRHPGGFLHPGPA